MNELNNLPLPIRNYLSSIGITTGKKFKRYCNQQKDAAFYMMMLLHGNTFDGISLNGVPKQCAIDAALDQYRFFSAALETMG